jgi:type IV pilus assembly protein PilV
MGMIDGLIALVILSFGMLGLTRMQAKSVALGTESQARAVAAQYGSELLNAALVDNTNYACYTVPELAACGNANARAYTTGWKTRVQAALPSATVTSTYTANGRLTVKLTWQGKAEGETRTLETTTDVR